MFPRNNVNKKILWLSDFDLEKTCGGAQRSDNILINKGRLLGHMILNLTFDKLDSSLNFNDFDVLITSNLHAFTQTHKNIIDKISQHKYHVRVEHDSNYYLSKEDREKLFGSCAKTFFLTDFHYEFFTKTYGDIFKNVIINYDPIDTNIFTNKLYKRENKILYAGLLNFYKGTLQFFEYALANPDKDFVVAGWADNYCCLHLAKTIPNVMFLGQIEYEKMPEIYNTYETMYYEPIIKEPFCRSVAEATLCGMKIITHKQDSIGSLLEINKVGIENFIQKCQYASSNFWENI